MPHRRAGGVHLLLAAVATLASTASAAIAPSITFPCSAATISGSVAISTVSAATAATIAPAASHATSLVITTHRV